MKALLTFTLFGILLNFSALGESPPWMNPQMTVLVRLYHNRMVGDFKAIDDLGKIIAQETSRGLVIYSQFYREDFHQGVTVCLQIDPRMPTSQSQKDRILSRIQNIDLEHQFDHFEIETPSNCLR